MLETASMHKTAMEEAGNWTICAVWSRSRRQLLVCADDAAQRQEHHRGLWNAGDELSGPVFARGREGTLWYYRALRRASSTKETRRQCLFSELARIVDGLETLTAL